MDANNFVCIKSTRECLKSVGESSLRTIWVLWFIRRKWNRYNDSFCGTDLPKCNFSPFG